MPIPKIIEEFKAYEQRVNAQKASAPADSFEEIAAGDQDIIWDRRKNFFYNRMIKEIRPEQLPALEAFAKRVMGEEAYNSTVRFLRNTLRMTDEYLAPKMENKLLNHVNAEGFREICAIVGEDVAERAWAEAQTYTPPAYDPTPLHPLENDVASLKEKLPGLVPDEEKRASLAADLDEINAMVTETNENYSGQMTNKNTKYAHVENVRSYKDGIKLLNDGAFGMIGGHMKYDEGSKRFGMQDFLGNGQLKNAMQSVEVRYSPAYKAKIIAILKRMDELGLVPENSTGKEEGQKIYGFSKLVEAQTVLKTAIKEGDVEHIPQLKAEYVKQTENMRELYAMVEDAIPDDNRRVPNNVDNMRTKFIPAEFKKSVSTNSNLNALWITLSFIKQSGTTIEEFVEKPISYLRNLITKQFEKIAPEKRFEGMDLHQVLVSEAYVIDSDNQANWLGTLRAMEMVYGDPEFQAYNQTAVRVLEQELSLAVPHAQTFIDIGGADNNRQTLANLFLVNDEDRDYAKMPTDPNKSADGFTEYPPFDPVKYLNEHDIDYQAMADRMGNAIKAFSDAILAQPDEGKNLKYDVAKMMRSVRVATARALLLKNPDPSEPGVKELSEFLETPLKALEKYGVNKETILSLNARMKNGIKDPIGNIEANKLNLKKLVSDKEKSVKGFTASEKAYNQKADTILKEAERISKQVAKEKDPAKVEKLQIESVKKMNELKALQKSEVERLENAFKDGKITAYYLKNRTEKIGSLNHSKPTAMFEADAFPAKDDYIRSTGLEELTSDEKKGLYQSAKMRALDEKRKFLGRRILEELKSNGSETKSFLEKEEISAEGVARAMNFHPVDTDALESAQPVAAENNPSSVATEPAREPIVVPEAMEENQPEVEAQAEEVKPPVPDKIP